MDTGYPFIYYALFGDEVHRQDELYDDVDETYFKVRSSTIFAVVGRIYALLYVLLTSHRIFATITRCIVEECGESSPGEYMYSNSLSSEWN